MNKLKVSVSNLFLSLASLIFIFIILEALTQIYIIKFAGESSFKKYASLQQIRARENKLKYTPHPYLRYYPTPDYEAGQNRHNSLGYRGEEIDMPKPDGRFRIVCIGGSTTYTNDVEDYRKSYPFLLEKKLKERGYENIDVINAGVSGWTSWESLINFELRVLDLDPDLIIVYHAINDIHARLVWPPEAYKGDNTGNVPTTSYMTMPSIFEYSSLLRILMINAGVTEPHSSLARFGETVDSSERTSYMMDFKKQKITNTYPQGIFKEVSAMQMLKTNTPKYFRRNISNIVTLAKANGIQTVLSTFAYSSAFKEYPLVSSQEYIYAYNEMNTVIREIAEKMNVHLFDFAKVFPQDRRYFFDGRHVNEDGARLKAELFANYLMENILVKSQ